MRDLKEIDSLILKELKSCCAKESHFLPKEVGLRLMESASTEISLSGVSAKSRNIGVEEQWSLTSFFGYSTQTFVRAVNLLDRFLSTMKVQQKHLPCIGVCCLHIAAKMTEEESNVSPAQELIRISHSKFTVSDLCRMETIILEKLRVEPKAATVLTFLHLYYSAFTSLVTPREDIPSIGRLEAQLKACLCQLVFSKAKPSVLALSLITREFESLQSVTWSKSVQQLQRYLKISDSELRHWRKLVAKCMTEYCSGQCNKPDNKKLVWIVSKRTAQNMQSGHISFPGLPTILERCWEETESESIDSSEDVSCGEESPCGSLGSDGEGSFLPSAYLDSRL